MLKINLFLPVNDSMFVEKLSSKDSNHLYYRSVAFVEQRFSPANLKPDIVVLNRSSRDATVVDVTCPYEGECDSFKKARAEKEQKYAGLKEWMKDNNYNSVTVHAFIVGSLGAWGPENLKTLKALHISARYSKLFSILCSVDALKGSHAIWASRNSQTSGVT